MIPSISHLSYYDRLRHLNIPSLQHCRRRGDLIYLYQILKGSYDIEIIYLPNPRLLQPLDCRLIKFRFASHFDSGCYNFPNMDVTA